MSSVPVCKMWQKSPHHSQSRELGLSVGVVEDCVGLMANSIVMACQTIQQVCVRSDVGQVSGNIRLDSLIFKLVEVKRQGSICQSNEAVIIHCQGANPGELDLG